MATYLCIVTERLTLFGKLLKLYPLTKALSEDALDLLRLVLPISRRNCGLRRSRSGNIRNATSWVGAATTGATAWAEPADAGTEPLEGCAEEADTEDCWLGEDPYC